MQPHAWRLRHALLAMALLVPSALHAQDGAYRSADVHVYYWQAQQRVAAAVATTIAPQRFPGLPADILQRGAAIHLFIASDAARFDSLTGGRAPEWGAGVAMPQRSTIVVPGYVSDRAGVHELPTIVRHELAHIALQRHLRTAPVPRWFTEGYATWAAGQFDAGAGWMLRLSFVTGAAPPLDSLTLYWPELQPDARLAYLLSASAVRYLYSLGSPDTFERFLTRWRDSGSMEQSLREVYLVSSPQFERLWRTHVRRTYGWTQILAQSMFAWLLLTLVVLVLFGVRRRRDRRRLQRLRESELPDAPAFWLETPPAEAEHASEDTAPDDPQELQDHERPGDRRA